MNLSGIVLFQLLSLFIHQAEVLSLLFSARNGKEKRYGCLALNLCLAVRLALGKD